jgi:hypothetical protein
VVERDPWLNACKSLRTGQPLREVEAVTCLRLPKSKYRYVDSDLQRVHLRRTYCGRCFPGTVDKISRDEMHISNLCWLGDNAQARECGAAVHIGVAHGESASSGLNRILLRPLRRH